MSENTKIEWCTSTGNPWIGCTKVSPGCAHCYAAELDHQRFSRTMGGGTKEKPVLHWGKGAPRFRTKGFWKDAVKWNKEFAKASIGAREARRMLDADEIAPASIEEYEAAANYQRPRIFPSLCDWLDEEVPIEWLADFLNVIADTPNLDWLLLTKRPELCFDRVNAATRCPNYKADGRLWNLAGCVPHNVWIGVSVEDQQRADERIPALLKIPAKVRFLSVEPLLGPVDLKLRDEWDSAHDVNNLLHWVIVGGESGSGARPCNIEWIRSVVAQCKAAGVSCFVKQLGARPLLKPCRQHHFDWRYQTANAERPEDKLFDAELINGESMWRVLLSHKKGGDPSEWPENLRVRQFPISRPLKGANA